jgi:hypothetical protein
MQPTLILVGNAVAEPAAWVGTLSVLCKLGGTGSRNCHLIEIGASPSQERKSTWPQKDSIF